MAAFPFPGKGQVIGFMYTTREILNTSSDMEIQEVEEPHALVSALRLSILNLKGEFIRPDGMSVDYVSMKSSKQFQDYRSIVQKLNFVDLLRLDENSRKGFLINIYNCLVIHAMVEGLLKASFGGETLSRLKFYAKSSYNIGGFAFNLNDIENGVLRANRVSAVPMTSIPFGPSDPRLQISLKVVDPRIHFALNCGAQSCPPIAVYSENPEELDRQLSMATENFIAGNVQVDIKNKFVKVSMIFSWYKADFGDTDLAVIQWISLNGPKQTSSRISELLMICPTPALKFDYYNWNVNSAA